MHKESMTRMKWFVENYIKEERDCLKVLDVGSYDVNGNYRELFNGRKNIIYTGLDMVEGPNVDYVPEDSYDWKELHDNSFDFIISGNAFEHIEYPWLTICEIYKKLKDSGFACIIAPNAIGEHRYPVDCYRYFSDGFRALAKWAGFTVINVTVGGVPNESASYDWYAGGHNDTMMILTKNNDEKGIAKLPKLSFEKRYSRSNVLEEKCHFLMDWINVDDKKSILSNFFKKHGIRTIYLYGYGKVGQNIYKELSSLKEFTVMIMDKNKESTDTIKIIKTGDKIVQSSDACVVSSLMDDSVLAELDRLYPGILKINISEILL